MDIIQALAQQLGQPERYVRSVVELLDEGNTVPFIARYRKEAHGGMDDAVLRDLTEKLGYLRNLDKRREEIRASIAGQDKLTPALSAALDAAATLAEAEDLYRPYRPKRRTRATIARERGLEPLAQLLFAQEPHCPPPEEAAQVFLDPRREVSTVDDALQGAGDIIAEWISDNAAVRKLLREEMLRRSVLCSLAAKEEESVYQPYYDFRQPMGKLQGHQVLAVNRGEREGFLKVSLLADRAQALSLLDRVVVRPSSPAGEFVRAAGADAYDRLLFPSLEREVRGLLTQRAQEGAVRMFGENLKALLLQPPVKGKVTMGLDPGYRNGCKVAVVDPTGKVLDAGVVYPTLSPAQREQALATLRDMLRSNGVEVIAIGNGTASQETEELAAQLLEQEHNGGAYAIVNEAGASVYSASPLASEEFPQYDVTIRSAISIARRLQDPLAELVKIDPKAIGVGQYQHDIPQNQLGQALSGVVEDCVNAVGADLNTASVPLLSHVAGLTAATARSIVRYREEKGAFTARKQLLKVPRLGPMAFRQCAGFLRIPESPDPLDHTAVHPESYAAATALLALCGYTVADAGAGRVGELPQRVSAYGEERAARELGIGLPTLRDIVRELIKPGRDPREELPAPLLRTKALSLEDLKPGMTLTGTVRNVTDFGAFVDVGVHQDGLLHVSKISQRYIRHPSQVLSLGDVVTVRVLSVDTAKKRIALTMREDL